MAIKKSLRFKQVYFIPYGTNVYLELKVYPFLPRCKCRATFTNNIAPFAYCCKYYFIETISVFNGTKNNHICFLMRSSSAASASGVCDTVLLEIFGAADFASLCANCGLSFRNAVIFSSAVLPS